MNETHAHKTPGVITYIAIFITLMVLTGITVKVAYLDLGALNTIIALTIASIKALLVLLFFMHLRYEIALINTAVAVGVLWLILLIGFVVMDVVFR